MHLPLSRCSLETVTRSTAGHWAIVIAAINLTGYDQVKAKLTAQFGDAAAVDLQLLGKGVFAVDDDGRLEVKAEAIVSGHLIIVLEQDEEDVNVTYVDLTAGYLQ